jgi:pyruvate formate lyase activating enzyme
MPAILNVLDNLSVEGNLYEKLEDNAVRCYACGHRCLIRDGKRGICKVRYNSGGTLFVPWGYVAALQADPIEKKPFNHVLPGSDALTFGMLGCDFHCSYCQNWITSQAGRDEECDLSLEYVRRVSPEQIVDLAVRSGAKVIASSYNEPLITTEWSIDIFKLAKQAGLTCVYISNGNATREALEALLPYLSAYKIDLKTMQDKRYRQLGGVLKNVLDSIRLAHEIGLWVEVVTLVVPGFNDTPEELMDAARYITSVSPNIPWHVTAFHPDYKMDSTSGTPSKTLITAAEIGQEAGLSFVYAGNLPGRVGEYENTYCPTCQTVLIERSGYVIRGYHITAEGTCPKCHKPVPGVWPDDPASVRLGGPGMPRWIVR